jgi:Raf kinase inhibitor-like YbhB/YbcL family protein
MRASMRLGSRVSCGSGLYRTALLTTASALTLLLATLTGCSSSAKNLAEGKPRLELTSTSIQSDTIPKQCTCDGAESSPQLTWSAPPAGTQSFALIAYDKDSPLGYSFTHWLLYDLPADKRELPEALPKQLQLPDGLLQGPNDFEKPGYAGPCPPGHSAHRYVFTLYALDVKLNLPPGVTRKQLEKAIEGHGLASGELIGKYQH